MPGGWLRRGCVLAAVAVGIRFALPVPVLAQDPALPVPGSPSGPAYGVVVVDMDRVLHQSQAGKSVKVEARKLHSQLQEDTERYEAELRAEEEDLTVRRGTLDAVDFEVEMRSFEVKVNTIRERIQARGAEIDEAVQDALATLSGHAKQALLDVAGERGVILALDHKVVLLYAVPDMTDDVIAALDAKMQDLPLNVADTEE